MNRLEDFPDLDERTNPTVIKSKKFLNKKRPRRLMKKLKKEKISSDDDCQSDSEESETTCIASKLDVKIKELNQIKNEIHSSSMNKTLINLLTDLCDLIKETDSNYDIYAVSIN